MFGIALGVVCGIGLIIGTVIGINKLNERKETVDRFVSRYNDMVDDNVWRDPQTKREYKIKEMPQLTFERFLTLYGAHPLAWHIPDSGSIYCDKAHIPYYVKHVSHGDAKHQWTNTIVIPVFWENWVEMEKFIKWRDNEYLYGKEAGVQKTRDEHMAELAGCLADDLQRDRKKFQTELEQMRHEIQLTLDPPVEKREFTTSDVDGDYVLMSDGTVIKVEKP
jgi:hypothetical protein